MNRFELHGDTLWLSPYFFSVFVALEEKGADYQVVPVAMERGAQRESAYQTSSVTGRVPALRHGEFMLAESSAITEYLEEVLPVPAVLGHTAQERGRVRQVMSWIRSDATLPLRNERSTHNMFYERAAAPLSSVALAARDKFIAVCTNLGLDGTHEFAVGGQFTLADADLALFAMRLILSGDPLPATLVAFSERHWARPSIAKFVQHPRGPLVPYIY